MYKSGQLPCPSLNFAIRMHILSGSIVMKNFNNFRVQPSSSYRQFTKFLEVWWDSNSRRNRVIPCTHVSRWKIEDIREYFSCRVVQIPLYWYFISRVLNFTILARQYFAEFNFRHFNTGEHLLTSRSLYNGHFFRGGGGGYPTTVFCKISVRRRKYCLEFSIAWGRLKISWWSFHSCKIFEAHLINSLLFSEV